MGWLASFRRRVGVAAAAGGLASVVLHTMVVLVLAALWMPTRSRESLVLLCEWSIPKQEPPPEIDLQPPVTEPVETKVIAEPAPGAPGEPDAAKPVEDPDPAGAPVASSDGQEGTSSGKFGTGGGGGRGEAPLGTAAEADQFVYVIDISTSLNDYVGGRPRVGSCFERVCHELLQSIEQLSPDQRFYVILFSECPRPMFDAKSPFPQAIPATPENKAKLRDWLATVELGGDNFPEEALRMAFAMRPNAVFFLSDGQLPDFSFDFAGEPVAGDAQTPGEADRGGPAQIPVHSIAVYGRPARVMGRLSAHTGGTYRYVPRPSDSEKGRMTPTTRANMLLHLAIMLESKGKREAAVERYRRIVNDFSGTIPASEARNRLERLSSPSGRSRR